MTINELVKEAYETAKSKGWHDTERSPLEYHALIHSEIAEATEAVRNGLPSIVNGTPGVIGDILKPEGQAVELADVVIRIADYAGSKGDNGDSFEFFTIDWKDGLSPLEFHCVLHNLISEASTAEYEFKPLYKAIKFIQFYFKEQGFDFWQVINLKMSYNKTRPHRHGGKKY